jgi:hypothetical protein
MFHFKLFFSPSVWRFSKGKWWWIENKIRDAFPLPLKIDNWKHDFSRTNLKVAVRPFSFSLSFWSKVQYSKGSMGVWGTTAQPIMLGTILMNDSQRLSSECNPLCVKSRWIRKNAASDQWIISFAKGDSGHWGTVSNYTCKLHQIERCAAIWWVSVTSRIYVDSLDYCERFLWVLRISYRRHPSRDQV